jgi:hypothetical protein
MKMVLTQKLMAGFFLLMLTISLGILGGIIWVAYKVLLHFGII